MLSRSRNTDSAVVHEDTFADIVRNMLERYLGDSLFSTVVRKGCYFSVYCLNERENEHFLFIFKKSIDINLKVLQVDKKGRILLQDVTIWSCKIVQHNFKHLQKFQ